MITGSQTPVMPKARRERLFVQDVDDELVIYDQNTRKTHRLNPTASLVWQTCDGKKSISDIAAALQARVARPVDEDLVRIALGQLEAANLLEHGLGDPPGSATERRRAFLRKAGAVSLLMPVVATLPRPSLAASLSPVVKGASTSAVAARNFFPAAPPPPMPSTGTATFAGGCFLCMEPVFERVAGVLSTTSGFMGGATRDPTYEQVSAGQTGHAEVVQVEFDPSRIAYATLLQIFWHNVDPTQVDGQFHEEGPQHRTVIFYHDEQQKLVALASKAALEKSKPFEGHIVTEIAAAGEFYRADEKLQDFYWRNPSRYKLHVAECGRTTGLQTVWGRHGPG